MTPDLTPTGGYSPATENGPGFEPGQIIAGRYRIVAALGKGGMGEVYRADDLTLGQSVALKFLPGHLAFDPSRLARFRQEVAAARRVSHPNVCRVYDIVEGDHAPFLTMEYVDGEDLAVLLRRIGRLPEDKAVEIARQLCSALAAVHEQGILHRDLKPANVMLDGRGKVRLTDFGVAALAGAPGDGVAGTPLYMAPEQLAGKEVSARSDLFSLGLVLYELFSGKRPFPAATGDELRRRYEDSTPSNLSSHVAAIDPAAERVVLRCLERDPAKRPRSAYDVLAGLPGGDPLAAVLAAGETPAPELVAAAGGSAAWPARFALACLCGTVFGLVLCVLLHPKAMLVGRVGLPHPTDVLAHDARTVLQKLGVPPPKDSAVGFDHDEAYLRWINDEDPSPRRWDRLERSRPAALYFWYRQSPTPLVPGIYYPYQGTLEAGRITLTDPPPTTVGMASVKLDLRGRLIELRVVPPERVPPGDQSRSPDWEPLFVAAGLDFKRFKPTAAESVPPVFADPPAAWVEGSPEDPEAPVRVEAASLAGAPVYFRVESAGPWAERHAGAGGSQGIEAMGPASLYFSALLFVALLVAAAVLAPRNWQTGRSDRKGAFRLAFGTFAVLMTVWAFETHHVAGLDELRLLAFGSAFALYWAGLLWLTYIALEPYARRLWPEALITWSRLLAGQWRDPRLGRDVLLGVAVGTAVGVVDMFGRVAPAWWGARTPVPYWDWWIPNTLVRGYWAGNFLINLVYSFRWAFFYKLLLFLVLRVVLQRPALTAAAYVPLATVMYVGSNVGLEWSWYWPFAAIIEVFLLLLLIRVGVLAVITAVFVWYCLFFPLTFDPAAWYAPNSLWAVGAVMLLAGYGFWTSRAGRPLFESGAGR